MGQPATILDDGDRRVPAFKLPWTRRGQLRYFTASDIDRIAGKYAESNYRTRQLQHFVAAFFGVLVLFCVVRLAARPSIPAALMAVGYSFMMVNFFRLARRKYIPSVPQQELTTILLAESHCPSCSYRLEPSRASSDGLTTCSECGAAWKLPAPTPPQEDASPPRCPR